MAAVTAVAEVDTHRPGRRPNVMIQANSFNVVETTLKEMKSVKFAHPIVTRTMTVPHINTRDMFYSALDIAIFRKQHKMLYGQTDRKYDRAHCEYLVESLDRIGADSFAKGDHKKALEAFNHSLRVRTETSIGLNPLSTANTIHCIADIYSKQKLYHQALDAYRSALEALKSKGAIDKHDIKSRRAVASLKRKIGIIESHLSKTTTRAFI